MAGDYYSLLTRRYEFCNLGLDLRSGRSFRFDPALKMSFLKMTIKSIGIAVAALVFICCLLVTPTSGQTYNEYMALGDSLYSVYDYPASADAYRAACEADSFAHQGSCN